MTPISWWAVCPGDTSSCLTVIYYSWYCSSSCCRGIVLLTNVVNSAWSTLCIQREIDIIRYHTSVGVCDCSYLFTGYLCCRCVCAGSMLLVLLMTMATASLSASFSVFLVRERANKSKHVQVHLASLSPSVQHWFLPFEDCLFCHMTQ